METRANYLLIGVFTLLGIFGSLGFLLWLAKVEIDRQYAYYDVLFDEVSGLAEAGDVRYNGLPVGQVVSLGFDEADPSKIRVRIEVAAETPVRTDTVARLQSQGVTGVSFVDLSGGSPDADPMPEGGEIRSERSAIQSVLQGAPKLLETAISLLEDINEVVDDKNRDAFSEVLGNAASATKKLDSALENFETLSQDLSLASREVAGFAERLDALSDTAEVTFATATETLKSADDAIQLSADTIRSAKETLGSVEVSFETATELMKTDIRPFLQNGNEAAVGLKEAVSRLEPSISATLDAAQKTFDEAEKTLASVTRVVDVDLGTSLEDFADASRTFTETINEVSGDIEAISAEVLEASRAASGFAGDLREILTRNRRQVSDFLQIGLPEFLRLTEEARRMVSSLDRLVDRVQRDPARFLLGTQGSEFNR